eukprot:595381-Rhodomonas_salina.1
MHITGIACTEQCTSLALGCMHASGNALHWHCKQCMHTEQPEGLYAHAQAQLTRALPVAGGPSHGPSNLKSLTRAIEPEPKPEALRGSAASPRAAAPGPARPNGLRGRARA